MSNLIGFSTGAIGNHDVVEGLAAVKTLGCPVVELSVLRDHEFNGFLGLLDSLDLGENAQYCSVHAPSKFLADHESEIIQGLGRVVQRGWPIVVHPDAIRNPEPWQTLGTSLLLENMDTRKGTGWTAVTLGYWFDLLPAAGLCFDIGHAFQVNPTGNTARAILERHGHRLRQVHMSHVDLEGHHGRLTDVDIEQYRTMAHLIPEGIPIIIESPVEPDQMAQEVQQVRLVLEPRP